MAYRPHNPSVPLLFGYDPERDLPQNHLARLVERVVEESLPSKVASVVPGQPAFDPRLCAKVLLYGYATGIRSSRQLQRLCEESLPYLYLTRGDTPSYRTLCAFRVHMRVSRTPDGSSRNGLEGIVGYRPGGRYLSSGTHCC